MMTCTTASPATSPAAESVLPVWSHSTLYMTWATTHRPADVTTWLGLGLGLRLRIGVGVGVGRADLEQASGEHASAEDDACPLLISHPVA